MSVSVEDQLRMLGRAFEEYVDDIVVDDVIEQMQTTPALSDAPDAADDARPTGPRGGPEEATPRWRRVTAVAAAIVLVLGIAGVLVVAQRPVDAPSGPATTHPEWYQALAPLLPDGFEHVAIQQSHQSFVQFEAFDPNSGKSLHISVSRSAMLPDTSGLTMTLAEARAEPWTDASREYDVSLPDGRQIGVYCAFRPMPAGEPSCPDLGEDRTDPEMLRRFVLALATDLSPDQLPPRAEELGHVAATTIRAAIGDAGTSVETAELEAPHYGFAFVQHGDVTDPGFFTVRTASGFVPPLPADTPRRSASVGGHRLTWQPVWDDTIWYVFDNPGHGVDVADEILDRAVAGPDVGKPEFVASVDSVAAQVVVRSAGVLEQWVRLDRGLADGIRVGMPVVGVDGMVGRVSQAFPDASTVSLLLDSDVAVGATAVATSAGGSFVTSSGVVTGRGAAGPPSFATPGNDLPGIGDVVYTAGGKESLDPPDIPIGRITRVTQDGSFDVESATDFERLGQLWVLLYAPAVGTTFDAVGAPPRALA